MREENLSSYIRAMVLILALLFIFTLAVIMQFDLKAADYKLSGDLYEKTKNDYVVQTISVIYAYDENTNVSTDSGIIVEKESGEAEDNWYDGVSVDMDGLQNINSDIVGWIYMENEDSISYPILLGKDNDAYIHTTYEKKSASAGSIFMDANNSGDFSDLHTVIYGHNMRDLSMFGKLRYFAIDKDYYNNHRYFQIITADKKYRYEIFSCKNISANNEIYAGRFTDMTTFPEYVKKNLTHGNYLGKEVDISMNDKVVTLSTCNGNDLQRFIVCGKLVDTYEY